MPGKKKRARAKRRARDPLTRGGILRAALAFADEHGGEALSMRELAREMGCGAMSLYNHVASKDEILDGMIDLVAGEIALPQAPSTDWKADLRRVACSAHETLLRHRWAAPRWSDYTPGPARLRYMDTLLRILREAGCSVETACSGFHAITTHVLGYTLQQLDFPIERADLPDVASRFLEQMPTEEFPWFAEHVQHHVDMPEQKDSFGFVLDLILDWIEPRSGARSPQAPR